MSERQQIQDAVQEKYGAIAKARGAVGCCGPAPCGCAHARAWAKSATCFAPGGAHIAPVVDLRSGPLPHGS